MLKKMVSNTTEYYQKVQLVVQYTEKDDTMIDFNWSILTNQSPNKKYINILIHHVIL